jgi:soluble lytic murein transglycosylase-like protein
MVKSRISTVIFVALMILIQLLAHGQFVSVDSTLATTFDAVLSPPSSNLFGPMPRELALRRVINQTEQLLISEGCMVDRGELNAIGRIVERASLTYRLPPSLIFSVIHSESHFDRTAMSHNGAIGLMQVQVETARGFADAAGLPQPTSMRLFDPETNITLGTGYLRALIDRFGNLRTALAAYNRGPTAIGRRVTEGQQFSDAYGRAIRVRAAYYANVVPARASLRSAPTEG